MLPADTRPRAFAGVELLLNLLESARSIVDLDLESVVIYYCVAEATMRPLVSEDVPADVRRSELPPEQFRGSISRMAISQRTGLPRETVRRKTNALVQSGFFTADAQGRVRTVRTLGNPDVRRAANDGYAAVQMYDARLRQLGCDGIADVDVSGVGAVRIG